MQSKFFKQLNGIFFIKINLILLHMAWGFDVDDSSRRKFDLVWRNVADPSSSIAFTKFFYKAHSEFQ